MAFTNLPYDLLLHISEHLDVSDVHSLQLTCKSLYNFCTTRPVYRKLVSVLLHRCRPLPLRRFQTIACLTTEQLIDSVNQAYHREQAWLSRTPKTVSTDPYSGEKNPASWYRIIGTASTTEEIDWVSPITSSYILLTSRTGKVVCWDIETNKPIAACDPGAKWQLWKCRVVFEDRMVFFTMAKGVDTGLEEDDSRKTTNFVIMALKFHEHDPTPTFHELATFKTMGVVMNIFLLNPSRRFLAAFIWIPDSDTIGLYTLLDWDKPEYVFIDTQVKIMMSNWTCSLYKDNIVIHSEENDTASQYVYPITFLRDHHTRTVTPSNPVPYLLSAGVPPSHIHTKKFTHRLANANTDTDTNPYPFPPWYPENPNFVRQWWPTLPGIPAISCTVILLSSHDPVTHENIYILSQHYFTVPLDLEGADEGSTTTGDVLPMRFFYTPPFEICTTETEADDPNINTAPRPLLAVDFGHATWIEYCVFQSTLGGGSNNNSATAAVGDLEAKRLRFVTFPPVWDEGGGDGEGKGGTVGTLEIPEELDLDAVMTINMDQSRGAVILSVKDGRTFVLYYE